MINIDTMWQNDGLKEHVNTNKEMLKNFYDMQISDCLNYNILDNYENNLVITTTAFNSLPYIEYQIKAIKKFITDKYKHIIFDGNNTDDKKYISSGIQKLCLENNVGYIKFMKDPWRPCKAEASYAIGAKLNWIYYNFILEKNIKYFGFIEQDIMPIKPIESLIKILDEKNMYGRYYRPVHGPGREKFPDSYTFHCDVHFIKTDFVKKYNLNFLADWQNTSLDTGGRNYHTFYKYHNPEEFHLISIVRDYTPNSHEFEDNYCMLIDDKWIHFYHGSGDNLNIQKLDGKFKFMEKFMDNILK